MYLLVTGMEVRSYGGPIIFSLVGLSWTNVTRNSGLVGPTLLVLSVLGPPFLATVHVVCRTTIPVDLHSCNTGMYQICTGMYPHCMIKRPTQHGAFIELWQTNTS